MQEEQIKSSNWEYFSPNVFASRILILHYEQILMGFQSLFHNPSTAPQREKSHKPIIHFDSHLNLLGQQNQTVNFSTTASQEISSIYEWARNQWKWPLSCHILAFGLQERKKGIQIYMKLYLHFSSSCPRTWLHGASEGWLGCLWNISELQKLGSPLQHLDYNSGPGRCGINSLPRKMSPIWLLWK